MNRETFHSLAETYNAIPVTRTVMADTLTPVSLFLSLRHGARYPFLLESVEGGERLARYSFLGRDPWQVLHFEQGALRLEPLRGQTPDPLDGESYFHALQRLTSKYQAPDLPGLPPLTGGAVGFSSYDTIRQVEHLPDAPNDDLNLPDAVWAFYDEIYAFDHVKSQIVLIHTVILDDGAAEVGNKGGVAEVGNKGGADTVGKNQKNAVEAYRIDAYRNELYDRAMERLDAMEKRCIPAVYPSAPLSLEPAQLRSNITPKTFSDMVETAKNHIFEGDIFQVVLSQRFEVPFEGDTFSLYRALRMVNPSPYLFYLDMGRFYLIGSSPEVLVRVTGREVRLLPIAGTRPRGQTHQQDLELEQDLIGDPKEIAEHVMLVDLGRNDLSRISRSGSVQLERNMVVERFSHVMHIVSDVIGELESDRHAVDALKHCFPAGTVSGAPKIRAMEIIDALEPVRRGPYAGAVGYFDQAGNMDTCIAIRTMVVTKSSIYIQAGAGIVADSVPQKEYEETENKAKALVRALSVALEF